MEWLSGRSKGNKRANALARLMSGEASLVIGTHALFQDDVAFSRLGLVIVDEQHRFGVHQRLALTQKTAPEQGRAHQLVMTATPIPRNTVHGGLRGTWTAPSSTNYRRDGRP